MNKNHRYFIQYMLRTGVSTVNNALNFCKNISAGKIENITQFKSLVIEINREISKQFYKIVFCVCEVTNQNLVLWLNTKNDDIAKFQITYSAIELEYFQAILQEIVNSEEHRITFIVCLNITSTLTSHFSRDSGQKVLKKWIKGGYFSERGDYIHLGARTILEFTAYLRSTCPDAICNLCSEIVFTGKKCISCDKTLHSYCLSTYLSNQNICPCCHNEWVNVDDGDGPMDSENIVYENGISSAGTIIDEDTPMQSGSTLSPALTRSQRRIQKNVHSAEYYSDTDTDEPGPSNRKRYK